MRNNFICLILLLGWCTINAQEITDRKPLAIQAFVRGSYVDYDVKTMPGLGFHFGKHNVFAGPLLGYEFRWKYPVEGFFMGYNYYPDWNFKRLSGHAIVQYQQSNYGSNRSEYALTAGYGLDFQIIDNLYIDQSFTIGTDGYVYTDEMELFYKTVNTWDFITTLQFGLRYEIPLRKSEGI